MSVYPIDKVLDNSTAFEPNGANVVVGGESNLDKFSPNSNQQETRASPFDEAEMTKRLKKSSKKWNRRFKILRCMLCCFGYKQSKVSLSD